MAIERNPIEWAVLPIKRYAQFSGRSSRAEYWWSSLAFMACGYLADTIDSVLGSGFGLFGMAFTLGLTIPSLAVTVRRLHDTDRSGWWLMLLMAPAAFFAFQASQMALAAEFDQATPANSMVASAFLSAAGGLVLLIFLVLPGNKRANRFGPDTYGPDDPKHVTA